ncbi:MAG: hypothetical protein ACOY5Y_02545 [Pseudomonadota bacterium]|jgi:hypothetical protein
MDRLNLNALLLWPLLAALVLILMSFQDPFRIAAAALLIGLQGPVWRWIHAFENGVPALRKTQ